MIRKSLLLACLLLPGLVVLSQSGPGFSVSGTDVALEQLQKSPHQLTVFLIPAKVKYDWSSPNSLYKSLKKNYIKNIFKKESFLLGHAFLELKTSLSDSAIFTGMRVVSRDEEKQYLLKDHYGLSILGADLEGRLETSYELEEKVEKYSKKKDRLSFMTLLINEDAAERMLRFLNAFRGEKGPDGSADQHYGGAYYPRYYGEGAGCTAFTVTFLDLAGLFTDEYNSWKAAIDIPADLMGGPYNDGNKVKMKDVRKRHAWTGPGNEAVDMEPFQIYDPSLMSEWIESLLADPLKQSEIQAEPLNIKKARGILIDCRDVPAPVNDSIFIERETPSVFVR